MMELPMISIKSKQLQAALGVTKTRSVKDKLIRFGVTLIDGEYISIEEGSISVSKSGIHSSSRSSDQKKQVHCQQTTPGCPAVHLKIYKPNEHKR